MKKKLFIIVTLPLLPQPQKRALLCLPGPGVHVGWPGAQLYYFVGRPGGRSHNGNRTDTHKMP